MPAVPRVSSDSVTRIENHGMLDGFGTIQDGYFVPHSHEIRWCGGTRLLLMPVGASDPAEALAEAPFDFQVIRRSVVSCRTK